MTILTKIWWNLVKPMLILWHDMIFCRKSVTFTTKSEHHIFEDRERDEFLLLTKYNILLMLSLAPQLYYPDSHRLHYNKHRTCRNQGACNRIWLMTRSLSTRWNNFQSDYLWHQKYHQNVHTNEHRNSVSSKIWIICWNQTDCESNQRITLQNLVNVRK